MGSVGCLGQIQNIKRQSLTYYMSDSLISVIVPVYNSEQTLHRCIDSILGQTYRNFELLLINDGSKDRSGEICDEYARKDSRVKVFHKENGGVSSARNLGLDNAKGEWITFIDSDDSVEESFLESLYSFGSGSLKICNFNGDGQKDYSEECSNVETSLVITKLLDDNLIWTPWGKLFSSAIINDHNLRFDTKLKLGEDTLFCWEYLSYCSTVSFLASNLYNYSGIWGGGERYQLTLEERLYRLSRCFTTIHNICPTTPIKTSAGIDHAKGVLLACSQNDFKDQKEIMKIITKEYNPKLDVDIEGGFLWKTLFCLIRVRCYRIASILMKYL